MKSILSTNIFSVSPSNKYNTGKLKQIFSELTGYDIMFEESRKDTVVRKKNKKPVS
jgi:hypothetical protein